MTEIHKGDSGDQQECFFTKVLIHKSDTLGSGAYGAVCKAKCDQLTCAAKLLHPVLFSDSQSPETGKEHRQPFLRFEQECQFLSRINHPNIVQYLGTYHDPETNAPVLLMELMDESLTHFLESSPGDIPYHIQVNLSQDIAQALAFLHANGIIHRDLSSNNVLLTAGHRAKISDFGMSKLMHLSATHLATMTQCPGTPVFMSPEALDDPPEYTEKLDTFSFGVLLIQILTRKFPKPSSQFEKVLIPSPHGTVKSRIPIPEVKRRQDHIDLIDPTHLLLPIALECLRDEATERPSSEKLCQFLYNLTKTIKYSQSSSQDLNAIVKAQEKRIKDLSAVIEAREKQIEELSVLLKAKDEIIEAHLKLEEMRVERSMASLGPQVSTSDDKLTSLMFQTLAEDEEFQLGGMRPRLSARLRQQSKDSFDVYRKSVFSKMLSDQGCPNSKHQAKNLQRHSVS